MAEHNRRPSIVSKRTHVREQKHITTFPQGLQAPPRIIDSLVAGLCYAGISGYIYHNLRRFSLTSAELWGLSLSSVALGFSLFDLGKRNGMILGASFALRDKGKDTDEEEQDDDAWKGEFRGREYQDLKVAEKIAWLKQEEARIKELQAEEQLKCGQAYIKKEEAYGAYEKFGAYGGADWKRYAQADEDCQTMYKEHEKQQKRLRQIRIEINELQDQI
ncbi:hypothetical protein D0Z07_1221 [Hyphodiscus hymeniophilus]|uniref:Uncharacterized protein n=1 Tax=Hyphodiscus hymeniophilus TaxID=353542 RepID=A0A9P6VRE8_9HELO|nr:hypothetical protein D0Z07_1221 [Hyphodiscus hymeniophilus]